MLLTPADIQDLVPAFVGAALVVLVVAGGILLFVWRQYPPPGRGAPADRAGLDPDRGSVKAGLRTTGWTAVGLGAAGVVGCVIFNHATGGFGPASLLLPASVVADGVMFIVAGVVFSPHA